MTAKSRLLLVPTERQRQSNQRVTGEPLALVKLLWFALARQLVSRLAGALLSDWRFRLAQVILIDTRQQEVRSAGNHLLCPSALRRSLHFGELGSPLSAICCIGPASSYPGRQVPVNFPRTLPLTSNLGSIGAKANQSNQVQSAAEGEMDSNFSCSIWRSGESIFNIGRHHITSSNRRRRQWWWRARASVFFEAIGKLETGQ